MVKAKYVAYFFVLMFAFVIIQGCGGSSEESVRKKINSTLQNIDGYKVQAKMTMNTGKEARSYDVNIWYKKGENDYYRVMLDNGEGDGGQIILKNDEGVFVLTPALKKSFKFQTDWPENSSQPYLYQSLVNDVLSDSDATFTASDTHHVFSTKTNYLHHTNLPYQQIFFDKKKHVPTNVKVMDNNEHVLIEVEFGEFELNPTFTADDFKREAILGNAPEEAIAEVTEDLGVLYPMETKGAELVEQQTVSLEDGERVIMTFKGDRNFTLIQEKSKTAPVSAELEELSGDLVDLGHSLGAVTNDSVEWNLNGTKFYLASKDLTIEELIEVASSVYSQGIK